MIGQRGATRGARVTRVRAGEGDDASTSQSTEKDTLAVEEPFEIRVSWVEEDARRVESLAVTMRTPGADFELAAGFLHGEGIVRFARDVVDLTYCSGPEEQEYNVVEVRLAPGIGVDVEALRRNFYTTSSCGVCGKASLEAVGAIGCAPLGAGPTIEAHTIAELPARLRERQSVFARTGGLHAAGVFDQVGTPAVVMEDVGRHNAVDKAVGRLFLQRALPAVDSVLVVSGRASFELVQKAVAAGIPVLVAVGAPSSLAVDLARTFGQTLVGFARDGGFNVYTGEERIG
ncbi:MAG: formate dehydrogenase accessory sulfurtransferase FdhD [Gemmatimonadetes bacterium]|nr:formate dehydrogenase accessory sulfurtransferase FdhD [Gemmatimonadota bacterium]